ncbi:hypothetical protein FIA58_007490 [Flavobacterium jejuense]|uniref:Uncharacterized protein n=1 Tax=Flavobacterium jejuense TaxID=1544455 RepID=A0ABX0INY1_9FLAO|nr:hypothetical protein [Flavobacterium jejuense]NHN25517.1 hypothetical protein [Flavobacterium jejuense]
MGLAEKRLAESIKTDKLPEFQSKLNELSGYDLNVEIDWNTFTSFDQYPLNRLANYVFSDITEFVQGICSDDMGKEAMKESVKAIHISNSDKDEDFKMELKDNVLYITELLAGDGFSNHRPNMLKDYVESLL